MTTRHALVVFAAITAATIVAVAAHRDGLAQEAPQVASPEQQLADRYTPVTYLREQRRACDRDGEGYVPAPVELVLDNPEVALKRGDGRSSATDTVIMMGPTAQDLAGLGDDTYLDFPGNSRREGCTFETDGRRFAAERGLEPTTYARIVVDRAERKLVLQYWMWWYFNAWNNTHEGDWEMVQLVFDTTSVDAALEQDPERVGYAQHGNGEVAEWGDEKLALEDGHPVIFPAAGSHASFFDQRRFISWGENRTGFGCDVTTAPSVRTPLTAVLIPEEPSADGPFAWLTYEGRWGERQSWEFNGPTGPNVGTNWSDPLAAMDNWRPANLYIPASNALGPNAADTFCSWVGSGSTLVIRYGAQPVPLFIALAAALSGLVAVVRAHREQLARAFAVYRQHLRTFVGIGLWTIPIGIIFNGFAILVSQQPPMEWVVDWLSDSSAARLFSVATVGGLQQAGMLLVVAPPVIHAMGEIRAGRVPGVMDSFRGGYHRFRPLFVGLLIAYTAAGVLAFWIIGIPLAIWLSIRWQFFGQAAVLGDASSGPDAVRMSDAVVRGRWWRTLGETVVFHLLALLPGPIIGLLLLVLASPTVQFANSVSSIIYAVTVPISVIGITLAYERARQPLARPVPTGPATPTAATPS